MSNLFPPISDLLTPEGAKNAAREVAAQTVKLARVDAKTQEVAIQEISRRHRLGSFIKKLLADEAVSIHLDKYGRLCRALEEQIELSEKRSALLRARLQAVGISNENNPVVVAPGHDTDGGASASMFGHNSRAMASPQ